MLTAEETTPTRTLLVCSSGGHLAQLLRLRGWWTDHDRRWVTFQKADSESLLEEEETVWAHHPTTRNVPNLLRNLVLAWRVLREFRPDVIVSNGAGVAFPFFILGRLLDIRTVYVEVYDRIDLRTMTGRLCRPFSDLFLVQWEEQTAYRGSQVIGRLL